MSDLPVIDFIHYDNYKVDAISCDEIEEKSVLELTKKQEFRHLLPGEFHQCFRVMDKKEKIYLILFRNHYSYRRASRMSATTTMVNACDFQMAVAFENDFELGNFKIARKAWWQRSKLPKLKHVPSSFRRRYKVEATQDCESILNRIPELFFEIVSVIPKIDIQCFGSVVFVKSPKVMRNNEDEKLCDLGFELKKIMQSSNQEEVRLPRRLANK